MTIQEARLEITRCAGSQFDPDMVRAFLQISIGDLRKAMGPLSWLTQLALFGRIAAAPAASTVAGTMIAVTGLGLGPVTSVYSENVVPRPHDRPHVVEQDQGGVGTVAGRRIRQDRHPTTRPAADEGRSRRHRSVHDTRLRCRDTPATGTAVPDHIAPSHRPRHPAQRPVDACRRDIDAELPPVSTADGQRANDQHSTDRASARQPAAGEPAALPAISVPAVSVPGLPIPLITVPVITVPPITVPVITLPPRHTCRRSRCRS